MMRVSQMFSQFYTNSKKETYHQGVPPPPALSGEGSFFMTCWDVRYFVGDLGSRILGYLEGWSVLGIFGLLLDSTFPFEFRF